MERYTSTGMTRGTKAVKKTFQALAGGLAVSGVISTAIGETAEDDLREKTLGIEKVSCSRPTNLKKTNLKKTRGILKRDKNSGLASMGRAYYLRVVTGT